MSTQVTQTPGGIAFAGFYYAELERELRAFLRTYKDTLGLSDESAVEVHTQLLRAFALMGHSNNTRLDMLATEMFVDSAQLLSSLRRLFQLMGVQLRSATPATVDIVCVLSSVLSSSVSQFLPSLADFSTDSSPPIVYEGPEAGVDLTRTDQVEYVYTLHEAQSGSSGGSNAVQVSSSSPGVVNSPVTSWGSSITGSILFLSDSEYDTNHGEFRVTERVDAQYIRVVRLDGTEPQWTTETGLTWSLKTWSSNHATAANTSSSTFTPWTAFSAGDLLYVMHTLIQWNQIDMTFSSGGSTKMTGVWEYHDKQLSRFVPDAVQQVSSTLVFTIDTLLGTEDRNGAQVTVIYLPTGAKQTRTSTFSSNNKITTTSLLGQTTPSTDVNDYHITAEWIPAPDEADGTKSGSYDMEQNGAVSFTLPQTETRRWEPAIVNSVTGNALRYRIIAIAASPTVPTVDRIRIDQGTQYLMITATQGQTVGPVVVGSSSGQAHQEFVLPSGPFLDDSEVVEVDESGAGTWTRYNRVESWLESNTSGRHYTRRTDANDRGVVRFGDNTRGKIPPAQFNNVRSRWRVGGDQDGNVAANQITVNADGVGGISSVYNPRAASGWRIKDGGDASSLERIRLDRPGELRTRGVAVTEDDVERLAVDFADSLGTKPVVRAWLVEEGRGLKSSRLVVVGSGGSALTDAQLAELETYFNGNRWSSPAVNGVLMQNHSIVAVNYQPQLVAVVCTVKWPGGDAALIQRTILNHLSPLALKDDGYTYRWQVGGTISFSNLYNLIHDVSPSIQDIPSLTLDGLGVSVTLNADSLPVSAAASVTVSIVQ